RVEGEEPLGAAIADDRPDLHRAARLLEALLDERDFEVEAGEQARISFARPQRQVLQAQARAGEEVRAVAAAHEGQVDAAVPVLGEAPGNLRRHAQAAVGYHLSRIFRRPAAIR